VFKRFEAKERLPYEINAWSTDVLHDVLKEVAKCSGVIGMFLHWLEAVVPNM
jgi:hypothetical protein